MNDVPLSMPPRQSVFDRIRGGMVLLLVAFGAFVLYYSLFFERKTTYLRDRNARLIARLGDQIRRSISSTGYIVANAANLERKELRALYLAQRGRSQQREVVFDAIDSVDPADVRDPTYHYAERRGDSLRITFERASSDTAPPAKTTLADLQPKPDVTADATPSDAAKTNAPESKAPKSYARGTITLRRLIQTMVEQAASGVFDTVFILDRSGNVIYQWTRQSEDDSEAELKIVQLRELRSPRLFEQEATLQASELMTASRQIAVRIGDRRYQLFSVPLRSGVHIEEEAHGRDAAHGGASPKADAKKTPAPEPKPEVKPEAKADAGIPEDTWAVCGVVANGDFRSRSLAMSPTLLCALGAVVLLMIFSWPFLKMALSSAQQKVTVADVVLLGMSGVLAMSILCLAMLDAFTFSKLESIAGDQLEAFSRQIEDNFGYEIFMASGYLDEAQRWAEKQIDSQPTIKTRNENLLGGANDGSKQFPFVRQPYFQSFSLIDKDGRQRLKWVVDKSATPLVSIATRTYFSAARDKGRDYLNVNGRPIAIESVRSLTSGQPEIVFARNTMDVKAPPRTDKLREYLPVIILSMPAAVSILDPVIPEGFGFAIVDDRGKVQFHSDSERNTVENFFAETDENPQVRSAVTTRQTQTMNIRYLGDDYTAHVRPMKGLPWTLITFRENDGLRTLNTEALLIALIFLLILTVACLFVAGLNLLVRPRYRAEWLWPDPRRVPAYAELAAAYVFLMAVAAVLLLTLPSGELLIFPFWFMPLVMIVTYLYLRWKLSGAWRIVVTGAGALCTAALLAQLWKTEGRAIMPAIAASILLVITVVRAAMRPEESAPAERIRERQTALPLCYTSAAFLLLLLTSVVPTTAFFKSAYEMEIDNYVKWTQMKLAGELKQRWWRIGAEFSDARGKGKQQYARGRRAETRDIYANGVFDTRVDFNPKIVPPGIDTATSPIPNLVAPIFPLDSDSAVNTRELVHDRAADNLWWWTRTPADGRLHLVMNRPSEKALENRPSDTPFEISSKLPQLLPAMNRMGIETLRPSPAALVALALLIIFAAAFWTARFIARRVFLVDLVHPLALSQGYIGLRHVVCHPCDDASARRLFRDFRKIDLATEEGLAIASTAPQSFAAYEAAVFIDGVGHSFAIGERSDILRALIDRLTRNTDRTVVLRPSALTVITRSFLLGEDREAWAETLSPFVWVNWSQLITSAKRITLSGSTAVFVDEPPPPPKKRWSWRSLYTLAGFDTYFEQFTDTRGTIRRTLKAETDGDPYLQTLVTSLSDDATGRDQILDEIGERAEEYYGALWRTCSADEQLVLMQLAQTGLVNGKTRKHLRRLLARGHLRRDPQLRVMNETFRRFVLAQSANSTLARELEHNLAGDAWSRFRVPFFASVAIVLLFFFMTQRQMFDSTIALVTGLAASLPAFLKMMSGLGTRKAER